MEENKMAFDKSLDKELFSETASFETTKIKVGVYSYNDGEKKTADFKRECKPEW